MEQQPHDDAAAVVAMPVLPITSEETLAACRAMRVKPGDIFIASYPKSGTTWTQNILTTLLLGGAQQPGHATVRCAQTLVFVLTPTDDSEGVCGDGVVEGRA